MTTLPTTDLPSSSSSHLRTETAKTAASSDPLASQPSEKSHDASQGRLSAPTSAGTTELSNLTLSLRNQLGTYPDFPTPGIIFKDILPLFASPSHHAALLRALELLAAPLQPIDAIVALEARGFLFGPTLALHLGCGFVPVRKKGKLPGKTVEAAYEKEYGLDVVEMQVEGAVAKDARVLIVDDIIATGGTAAAAGELVKKVGGHIVGYLFIMELGFLNGRARLDAPVHTLLSDDDDDKT